LFCFVFNPDVHIVTGRVSLKALRVSNCMAGTHTLCTSRTLHVYFYRGLLVGGMPPHCVMNIKIYSVTSNSLALFGKCQVYNTCLE
jgi:hypothetical protein